MRSFKEATRVFWHGWAQIFDYLAAVKDHGWEVLWDAGMIGIPFGIATLIWSPSWRALGYVLAAIVFVAGYHLWRDLFLRVQPKLKVGRVTPQSWEHQLGRAIAYYFFVFNTSSATSIEGIEVRLIEIDPPLPNTHWIPAHLFQKNDNEPGPRAKTFSLNPGDEKAIDLVAGIEGNNRIEVRHIVENVSHDIPTGKYRFKVRITAENTLPVFAWFRIETKPSGELQCEMENMT